jgi:integrase
VSLARLAPSSRRTLGADLTRIARLVHPAADALSFPWAALRYQHTAAIRAELATRVAPATANRMLSALRGVLGEAWRLGLIDAEALRRAVDLRPVRGSRLARGRALGRAEVAALLAACAADPTPAGARDGALIAIGYACGLRRAELVGLTTADVRGDELRIRGKGNRERVGYLTPDAGRRLAAWLRLRGEEPGPLFVPVRRGGHLGRGGLTAGTVLTILARRARQAGVADLSPHDLRRTMITTLLERGVDLHTVAQLAGHASIQTTVRYDRRGEAARRRAAALLALDDGAAAGRG